MGKNRTDWSNVTKNTTDWTAATKNTTNWQILDVDESAGFLLLENSDKVLIEIGDILLLE